MGNYSKNHEKNCTDDVETMMGVRLHSTVSSIVFFRLLLFSFPIRIEAKFVLACRYSRTLDTDEAQRRRNMHLTMTTTMWEIFSSATDAIFLCFVFVLFCFL